MPSEGGHSDFAPHTEQQIELLRFMRYRYPQVSWELILSGRGFRTLHEFLAPEVVHASFEDPGADPAPEITRRGLDKSCRVCSDTLDLWTAIYGAEAGNLALKVLALGGVYVAGGIAVKILEKMKEHFSPTSPSPSSSTNPPRSSAPPTKPSPPSISSRHAAPLKKDSPS